MAILAPNILHSYYFVMKARSLFMGWATFYLFKKNLKKYLSAILVVAVSISVYIVSQSMADAVERLNMHPFRVFFGGDVIISSGLKITSESSLEFGGSGVRVNYFDYYSLKEGLEKIYGSEYAITGSIPIKTNTGNNFVPVLGRYDNSNDLSIKPNISQDLWQNWLKTEHGVIMFPHELLFTAMGFHLNNPTLGMNFDEAHYENGHLVLNSEKEEAFRYKELNVVAIAPYEYSPTLLPYLPMVNGEDSALLGQLSGWATWVAISLPPTSDISQVRERIDFYLNQEYPYLQTQELKEVVCLLIPDLSSLQSTAAKYTPLVTIIACTIIGLTQYSLLQSNIKDYWLLGILGLDNKRIWLLVVIESILIFCLGYTISLFASNFIGKLIASYFTISYSSALFLILIAIPLLICEAIIITKNVTSTNDRW